MKKYILFVIITMFISVSSFGAEYREIRNDNNILVGYTKGNTSYSVNHKDIVKWLADGNIAEPDLTVLNRVKNSKIQEYRSEGVRRIALQVPEWNHLDKVAFVVSVWNMLRTPNASQARAKDIYVYFENTAIPNVNAQSDIASVQAIDVLGDVNWP